MNTRKTATQIRAEIMEKHRVYAMLAEHPHLQAEKIAKHYVAHAQIALDIVKILERINPAIQRDSNVDFVIEMLVNQIKTNHRVDLGIDLEWLKNPDRSQLEWLNQALNEGDGSYKP